MTKQIVGFICWVGVCFVVAAVGAAATVHARGFYAALVLPAWAPPGWLFGPVWSVLYLLMGIAAWLVWRARGIGVAKTVLGLFLVQLAVNGLWSWLFFHWRLGGISFAEIVILWMLIVATLVGFWRVRPAAGVLLLPYLAWVSFAAALCFAIWRMNPGM